MITELCYLQSMRDRDVSALIQEIWNIFSSPDGGKDFSEFLETLDISKMSLQAIVTVMRASYAYREIIPEYKNFVKKCHEYVLTITSPEYTEKLFKGLITV